MAGHPHVGSVIVNAFILALIVFIVAILLFI